MIVDAELYKVHSIFKLSRYLRQFTELMMIYNNNSMLILECKALVMMIVLERLEQKQRSDDSKQDIVW